MSFPPPEKIKKIQGSFGNLQATFFLLASSFDQISVGAIETLGLGGLLSD